MTQTVYTRFYKHIVIADSIEQAIKLLLKDGYTEVRKEPFMAGSKWQAV